MRIVDWIARTVMLALASLATLALIGSLASVSDSTLGEAFPGRVEQAAGDAPAAEPAAEIQAEPQAVADAAPTPDAAMRVPARPASDANEIARWLKALTYAVLALTGFVAAAVVALVRIAGHLDRATLR